jgi:O-antigen biosynthesis protein
MDVAQDPVSYGSWMEERERIRVRNGTNPERHLELVLVCQWPAVEPLRLTVRSLSRQTDQAWFLTVLAEGGRDVIERVVKRQLTRRQRQRFRCLDVSVGAPRGEMLEPALSTPQSDAIALIFAGDVWAPDAVALLAAGTSPTTVVYADEDTVTAAGEYLDPKLKPDYSPDFLFSTGYVGRPLAMGRSVVRQLPALEWETIASLEQELTLAACAVADSVAHIAEVLCHRSEPTRNLSSSNVLRVALERRGEPAEVRGGPKRDLFDVFYQHRHRSLTSVLIPFKDQPRFLRTCVDSVTATTVEDQVEFVLIDNGSTEPEMLTLVERLDARTDVKLLSDPRPFNWARLNNLGAAASRGEVLLFLNDDIEAITPGWLTRMHNHALRPDVGAVGARLLYPNRRLQHCGVAVGLGGAAGHLLAGLGEGEAGYLSMAIATRECSAVTGACLASRREVYDHLEGFDEALGVDLNDVDYCLRAGKAGFRTIFEAQAELLHHESPSRGTAGGLGDIVRFVERWDDYILAGDPYLNTHLTRTDRSCALARPDEEEVWNRWRSNLTTS